MQPRTRARPPAGARLVWALLLCMSATACLAADPQLPPSLQHDIEARVTADLARTGVPSASIAIVRDGEIAYAQAFGWADLASRRAATPQARYAIGSVSKQFTAAALLLLQERGALRIDDAAGKWLPSLTGPGREASIRSLLSHTSGLRDFWPQDYDPPEMLQPVQSQAILDRWANQPLDFATGTAWQYSNTGYTVAGMIAERVGHAPLFEMLRTWIFAPLAMTSVYDFDAAPLQAPDAVGYTRYALGPPRPAAKEGRGWLFAAGELAMTASDLARWDIALMQRRLLSADSYRDLTSEVLLQNGVGTGYALGLDVSLVSGRRVLQHDGEVGGFTAQNRVYPDAGLAIVVLVNQDATGAPGIIADDLAQVLFERHDAGATADVEQLFTALQRGHIDAQRLTANARSYFSPQALADFHSSLGPLGKPQQVTLVNSGLRGGLATRVYKVSFRHTELRVVVRLVPDGRIEQLTVSAQ
ncbi:MAG: beta-lactamase family protein [Proteobacteria bacterium]|nr:beta-lactamase family protein [Pseudomonadota bacterium]